jgi:hypothetical protein
MNQHNPIQDDNDLYSNRQFHQKQLMLVVHHLFHFHLDLFDQFFAIEPIQFNYIIHYCHAKTKNNNVHFID